MADELKDYEPPEIIAGETLQWTKELDDYSASDGYALSYYFRNADGTGFNAEGTPDGTGFVVTVPSSATAPITPGAIYWQAWITKAAEKHAVGHGQATVRAGFAASDVDTLIDIRSPAKKILDALDALLAGKATRDQLEYQIAAGDTSRSLKTFPPSEWITLRKMYAGIVARERRRERVRRGGTLFQSVKVRFDNPR